ncbi:anti-sigma factor family protein [Streptomyces sp. CRN 30]|uniref:anti-sigma factor family protein n=1 Tax=Streptomyces sp. CRN 30 TaxID=3075613 RepID=UPI002A838110|nr:zf-HC2 domain-containing protein [Streptomyces sp. CRN 30]
MSGSRPKGEGHLAEQHLGDRLSALVDGELGHDARERVLAHVATCHKCKAEVDAQRRLKNVFAEAAPPAPSESFLARLQGLPAGDDSPPGGDGPPAGLPDLAGRFGGTGAFGVKRGPRFEFDYVPSRSHASVPAPAMLGRGFRIHDVGRHDAERSASRGLRFAWAAAGAVSLAAVALGGVTAGVPDTTTEARGASGTGSNVTPARTQGTGSATAPESLRRRAAGPLLGQTDAQGSLGGTPVAPTAVSAPLLPGLPAPSAGPDDPAGQSLAAPVMAGAVAMSPLIRPFDAVPPVSLTSWLTTTEVNPPGLLTDAVPDPSPAASSLPSTP